MRKDTLGLIQAAIDYIEQNLKTEIDIQELCRMAGYSEYHFCQLFQKATGLSVKQYLVCRRLKHAVYEISQGVKKQEAAFTYGFDTYAGFYKAFCREYGCSPSEYLKAYHPSCPYKINLLQEGKVMISKKIMDKLLAHWGMEECPVNSVYYEGSNRLSENEFYVGEEYVLKVSGLPGGLKQHMEIAEALDKAGLQASLPVATGDGEFLVQEAVVEYKNQFGTVYEKLPKQIIHRNMNLSYVYVNGESMVGVTDFELSEYSIRLFDVCYAATGILSENFSDEEEIIQKWLPLYQNIIRGYDAVVKLTEEEKQMLPYVVFSIQLICVAYFADKEEFAELARVNEKMLLRLMECREDLKLA